MALSPSVRKPLTAGKGWECGRDKLCFWFSCQPGGDIGAVKEWEPLGWPVLDVLAAVTDNASKIVVEGRGPAPCLVSEGKLHKTCQGEELAVILELAEVGPGRGPGERVDTSTYTSFSCACDSVLGQPTSEAP